MATRLVTLKDNDGTTLDIQATKFQAGESNLTSNQLVLKKQEGAYFPVVGLHTTSNNDELVVDGDLILRGVTTPQGPGCTIGTEDGPFQKGYIKHIKSQNIQVDSPNDFITFHPMQYYTPDDVSYSGSSIEEYFKYFIIALAKDLVAQQVGPAYAIGTVFGPGGAYFVTGFILDPADRGGGQLPRWCGFRAFTYSGKNPVAFGTEAFTYFYQNV